MNANDMIRLEKLNERYSEANLTGFRFVTEDTDRRTVIRHIKTDLEILSTSDVENKRVYRVIIRSDSIDICSKDNGTPIAYLFCEDARFSPEDLELHIQKACRSFGVYLEDLSDVE